MTNQISHYNDRKYIYIKRKQMLKILPTVIGCLGLMATTTFAETTLKTQEQKAGYFIGIQMGTQLKSSKDDIDLEAVKLGMQDIFSGTKQRITNEEMQKAMMNFQNSKQKREMALLEKSKKESIAYLETNKKKDGVVTLESGLQYKVIKSGEGKVSPKLTDTVVTHYRGTLTNGTLFDSSYDRGTPATFPVNGVIPGWTEALQKMKVGDKWQLVIPGSLAYGKRGAPPVITPDATLLFDIELLEIKAK